MSNPFFKNFGPLKISEIIKILDIKINLKDKDFEIHDIKDLNSATKKDITFLHSKKYKDISKSTKASYCLTTKFLKSELPSNCIALVVENVLLSTSKVTSVFYPESVNDDYD